MRYAAAAAPPLSDSTDPRVAAACVRAERMAREIVLAAHEASERLLAEAREEAATRVAELVAEARVELGKIAPPPSPDLAAARVRAETEARCAAIVEQASERAAHVLAVAEAEAGAVDAETRRQRTTLEQDLRELARERASGVRALEAQVASVRAAGTVADSQGSRRRPPRLALVAALVVAVAAAAGVGGWQLSSGNPGAAPLIDPPAQKTAAGSVCPIPGKYRSVFVSAAARENVPLSLLTSVAAVESRWQPGAVSARGAIGLMQMLRSTAAYLHVNPYNWRQNVLGGARFLKLMLAQYHGNTELALSAYNAGPGRVAQGNVPLETVVYVGAVMAQQAQTVGCR